MSARLILASSSPRRRDLLAERGYRFTVVTAVVEELSPAPPDRSRDRPPQRPAQRLRRLRAPPRCLRPRRRYPRRPRRQSPWKARHPRRCTPDARPAERPHPTQVFSGVWFEQRATAALAAFIEISHVRFRPLSLAEIDDYLTRVHVLDKAGAYAAQEDPINLIAAIIGSRTNVIGLPMERLEPMLGRRGIKPGP